MRLFLNLVAVHTRQIIRALKRRPAYTTASILTLALGLGAAATITAAIDGVLLRPLPYPRPERLYSLSATLPGPDGQPIPFVLSAIEIVRARAELRSFEQVEAMTLAEMALTRDREPATVRAGVATAGFLRLLGLQPGLGRDFTDAEDRDRAAVAILDGGYWRRQFAGDSNVIGTRVLLDGRPHVVIGVTAEGYQPLLQQIDVWVPLGARIDPARLGIRNLLGVARLASGATEQDARSELDALSARIGRDFPQTHAQAHLIGRDLHERLYGSYREALLLLFGAVSVLLAIASANVANLTVGRVSERTGEIALRLSIGASPGRILAEQLAESLMLTLLGGAVGICLAIVATPWLLAIYPAALPADVTLGAGWRVVAIVAAQTLLAALVAGLVPAWRAYLVHTQGGLEMSSSRHTGTPRDRRTREAILAAQIAFAVALLGTAAVVGASLQRLSKTDPGFHPEGTVTLQLAPPVRYSDVTGRANFVERMITAVAALPGVVAAGTTQTTWQPLASMQAAIDIDGQPTPPGERRSVNIRHITSGYFPALRVAVVEGRAIGDRDRAGTEPVAMVSASFAAKFFPGGGAVGHRIRRSGGAAAPWLTIVGVARDVQDSGLGLPIGPTIYVAYLQQNTPTARVTLVVRTDGDPEALAPSIQRAIWSVDAQQPIDGVRTLERALGDSIAQPRFRTYVLALFGVIGVLLACVGVYGVAAYAAAQRGHEIGVRLALGATGRDVMMLLVRRALPPIAGGLALGTALSLWLTQYLASMLNGVETGHAASISAACVLLGACALLATWVPCRRAARTGVMSVLRLG